MKPGHELVSSASADAPTPRTSPSAEAAPVPPHTSLPPSMVLQWIAAKHPDPWFPSVHARQHHLNRDRLDEPLNALRIAELVRIATWVRGDGQGYALTPAGEAAAKDPAAVERATTAAPALSLPEAGKEPAAASAVEAAAAGPIEYRPPLVTPTLIAANMLWFFVGLIIALQAGISSGDYLAGRNPGLLHRLGAVSAPDLIAGQWWRLMTSCFVHVGGLHLLGNMFALGMMGPLAELLWGRWRMLVIYLLAGLAGSCLAMAHQPIDTDSGALTILAGASGAIWGVLGSLLAWLLMYRQFLPEEVAADLFRRLGIVLLLNVGVSVLPGVSWQAHLGGGLAGFLAASALNALRFGDRPRKIWGAIALAALPVLSVAGLMSTMQSGDAWAKLRTPPTPRPDVSAANAAVDVYNQTIVPLLMLLAPEPVAKVEQEAKVQLVRAMRKKPANPPDVVKRVQQLRGIAAEAVAKLGEPPTGVPEVDLKRTKARAFADARLKSFDLLLSLLTTPDDGVFEEWLAATAEANRLWNELGQK